MSRRGRGGRAPRPPTAATPRPRDDWYLRLVERAPHIFDLYLESFDGEVFDIIVSDVPGRKTDLVNGEYELSAPKGKTTVAVKLVDMLGEEVLETATL